MTDSAKASWLLIVFGILMLASAASIPKKTAEPRVEYRYIGDKSRPENWLRKYSVPTAYYVWDDELGRYSEVSKEKFDSTPLEDAK